MDGLVNAAGLSDRGSVAGADIALFDQLFAVNTRAPMFLMQGMIRHLKERNTHGGIVNILSFQAHGASINLAIYGATKAAMSLLTKNAAYAHREDRIRINGINLGWADTPGEREMQAVKLGKGESWLAEAGAMVDTAGSEVPAGVMPPSTVSPLPLATTASRESGVASGQASMPASSGVGGAE